MKLVDFHEFEAFNALRERMGQADLGQFELFDPLRHLTWQERQELEANWVSVPAQTLHSYSDKTLAYKNSHVFSCTDEHYHFALCDKLTKRIGQGRLVETRVTLNTSLLNQHQVCEYCLHAVSYQGFDAYRHRHQEYNDQIIKQFRLETYLASKFDPQLS